MPVIFNASTVSGLQVTPDNSGQIQFQLNGVNVPSPSVAPAFSAYQSVAQSISANTTTKVMFQSKEFDTNNNFDATTNYRFTPTVAGYYQITAGVALSSIAWINLFLYKNGSVAKQIFNSFQSSVGAGYGSALIYMNGSTDYIETYIIIPSTQNLSASSNSIYFQASLVRTA